MTNGQILSILKALSSDDSRVSKAIRNAVQEIEKTEADSLPPIDGAEYYMIVDGDTIGAIKSYKGRVDCSLREAKMMIDRARAEHVWGAA